MQVKVLINQLKQFKPETEVRIYFWDRRSKKHFAADFTIELSRFGWGGLYMVEEDQAECMVGGHIDGCLCNLGFTPRI